MYSSRTADAGDTIATRSPLFKLDGYFTVVFTIRTVVFTLRKVVPEFRGCDAGCDTFKFLALNFLQFLLGRGPVNAVDHHLFGVDILICLNQGVSLAVGRVVDCFAVMLAAQEHGLYDCLAAELPQGFHYPFDGE